MTARDPSAAERLTTGLGESAAPPRRNGELVFDEPWQSRAFGVAVAHERAGFFPWNRFRQRLIAHIAEWERSGSKEPYEYYRHWLGALEDVVVAAGLVDPAVLAEEAEAIAARPPSEHHRHDDDLPHQHIRGA